MKSILSFSVLVIVLTLASCGTIGVSQTVKDELQAKNYPIAVIKIVKEGPNSAGGVAVYVSWQNISDKDIKYAVFQLVPYNAVNDIQRCEITRRSLVSLEDTGPVKPDQMVSMSKWANVWYNSTIDHLGIKGLEITFMDGTKITFDEAQATEMFIDRNF